MKNKLPPFIEIYRALIATPSISATEEALDQSNADLITLLADWFKDLGFNVEVQPVPGTRNKFNMLASIGQGAGGLLLAGHTDTVPFDDGRWTRDPFTLTEHDGKLYGLRTHFFGDDCEQGELLTNTVLIASSKYLDEYNIDPNTAPHKPNLIDSK